MDSNKINHKRLLEEDEVEVEKPADAGQTEEASGESAAKEEQEPPTPAEDASAGQVDEGSPAAAPAGDEEDTSATTEPQDGDDGVGSAAEEAPDVPPPAEDESQAAEDEEQKDLGEAEAEAGSEPASDESATPADAEETPTDSEESDVGSEESTNDDADDAATAEEALSVIDEIAKVEGESPEEVLEELHEEAEDLEYLEEELDEMGDDLTLVEEEIDQEIAEEIAQEMGEEVDNEVDVPEDLSGKGMISTDASSYDPSSPIKVSFEIDPFLPGDWIGLYPFDAAYHDYDTDTLRVPHPSVEWLFLCGSHDCDGNVDSGETSLEFLNVEQGKWKVFLLRDSWGQSGSAAVSYLVIAESETFVVGDVDEESFGKVSGELGEESGSILSRVANGQLSNATVAGITALVCIVIFLFVGWKVSKRRETRGHAVPSSAVELAEQGEWT